MPCNQNCTKRPSHNNPGATKQDADDLSCHRRQKCLAIVGLTGSDRFDFDCIKVTFLHRKPRIICIKYEGYNDNLVKTFFDKNEN